MNGLDEGACGCVVPWEVGGKGKGPGSLPGYPFVIYKMVLEQIFF
jgi:hypothetical protein